MKHLTEKKANVANNKNSERASKHKSKLERMALPLIGIAAVCIIAIPLTAAAMRGNAENSALAAPTPTPAMKTKATPSPAAVLSATDELIGGESAESNFALSTPDKLAKATVDPSLSAAVSYPAFKPLYEGIDDALVATVQTRLMELSFMDNDEPTEHFGPMTRQALEAFQRQHDLEVTGSLDATTYSTLTSPQAQTYVVSLGMSGSDVETLQMRLYQMSYLKASPTGYFGTDTENAVKLFQERNSISVTGIIDDTMRALLYSDEAIPNVWTPGTSGADIETYQQRLFELGYLTVEPTGEYGDETIAAVKRFQEINALVIDGFLGPDTISALMADGAISNALVLGMSGGDVEDVQKRLCALKYLNDDMATGYFGSVTQYAVRIFQKTNSLDVDGRVGRRTMAVLLSDSAKPAPDSYKPYVDPTPTPKPKTTPKPSSAQTTPKPDPTNNNEEPSVGALINVAESRLGCRYRTGGKGPNVFDCSGFVYWCLNQVGIRQSYMTSREWRNCTRYRRIGDIDDVRAGDVLVFYGHVGLAVSNNEMIDASSSRGAVVRRSSKSNWCRSEFICAFRIFD